MTRLEGEELLKSILDNTPHGIIATETVRDNHGVATDFEIKLLNKEGERLLSQLAQEVEGQYLKDFFKGIISESLFQKLVEVAESGNPLKHEIYIDRKGSDQWISLQAAQFGDGLTLSFIDISEEKLFSNQLTESETKYRKLFEESMDSIFIMNNEYLILEANHSMVEYFGYSQKEVRFLDLKEFFVDEETFWHFNKELYKNNRIEEFEAELTLANGKKAFCLINLIQLDGHENDVSLYQGVIKDINKRKQAESELLLAEKLSMTGKIARSIAHEVRNPLTNLNLALEQLKEEVPKDLEDADLYFNIIARNARRVEELISSLLESSKPKSLSLEKKNLNEVINSAITVVEDRIKLQQMSLKTELAEHLPSIPVDYEQLKVAIVNLMINAIEAMKSGEGELTVQSSLENQQVKVVISDNGKGISPEDQRRLFDPFFTAKKGGMGLGLTSVQNIVQSHLGEITVESEMDKGTSFIILFSI